MKNMHEKIQLLRILALLLIPIAMVLIVVSPGICFDYTLAPAGRNIREKFFHSIPQDNHDLFDRLSRLGIKNTSECVSKQAYGAADGALWRMIGDDTTRQLLRLTPVGQWLPENCTNTMHIRNETSVQLHNQNTAYPMETHQLILISSVLLLTPSVVARLVFRWKYRNGMLQGETMLNQLSFAISIMSAMIEGIASAGGEVEGILVSVCRKFCCEGKSTLSKEIEDECAPQIARDSQLTDTICDPKFFHVTVVGWVVASILYSLLTFITVFDFFAVRYLVVTFEHLGYFERIPPNELRLT